MPPTPPSDLESLARAAGFTDLTEAELKLLHAAPIGKIAVCGPNTDNDDPANDPAKADQWGKDREIRAHLIRWLCVDREAKKLVDPQGIRAYGAKITEKLDLSFVTVSFPLLLAHCRLMDDASLRNVEIPGTYLQGTWVRSIAADGVNVRGDVNLRNGFRAEGEVRFPGAQIGGNLDCSNGTFANPPKEGTDTSGAALFADNAVVKGSVNLRDGFRAEGTVRLLGAQIGGDLDCSGGTFANPSQEGPEASRVALGADGIGVDGSVFLRDGFRAEGTVRLVGAQIGGQLSCEAGSFTQLQTTTAVIQATFHWRKIVDPESVTVDFTNTSVDALVDDAASWPAPGNLILDGFVYDRIYGGPRDASSRLDWLARQKGFAPQPYRQLAKVLRDEGDDSGARLVLFEMEHRRRQKEDRSWFAHVRSFIFRCTVGYGYYPRRALGGLLILALFGFLLYSGGYSAGSIAPTDKEAYSYFKLNNEVGSQYEGFYASIYSLENSFPLVKLGQVDRWQPDPSPQWECRPAKLIPRALCVFISPSFLRWFRWVQICLGWFFATMGVAAVTGIVRRD